MSNIVDQRNKPENSCSLFARMFFMLNLIRHTPSSGVDFKHIFFSWWQEIKSEFTCYKFSTPSKYKPQYWNFNRIVCKANQKLPSHFVHQHKDTNKICIYNESNTQSLPPLYKKKTSSILDDGILMYLSIKWHYRC